MNRCVVAFIVASSLMAGAMAQTVQRGFPANALRGEMSFAQPPEVVLNGQTARLAPGARIRGQNNMLQMSGSLMGQSAVVHYVVGVNALVQDVWILTEAEREKKPWPKTPREAQTWLFDPIAQVWTQR